MAPLRLRGLRSPLAGPFDLEVAAGECVAVTGASGSGKSLLLRMAADLDPHEGDAWIGPADRAAMSGPAWRRQVVYLAAESGWWTEDVAAHFADLGAARRLAAELQLKPETLDGPVARLSSGERQRLALIRALQLRPAALLLDEPTGALDPAATGAAEGLLRRALAEGTAIVLVTHDAVQAGRLAHRRFAMQDGRLHPA